MDFGWKYLPGIFFVLMDFGVEVAGFFISQKSFIKCFSPQTIRTF